MTPLAQDIYEILRQQVPAADGRITYGHLIELLPGIHGINHPRDSRLDLAYAEIVLACRRHGLPLLPAILVQQNDDGEPGQPGNGYFEVAHPEAGQDPELRTIAWARDWQQVRETDFPEHLNG